MGTYFTIEEGRRAPNFQGMMFVTVCALQALGGAEHIDSIEEQIIEIGELDADEQSYMMPNATTTKLKYYLSWARTYLKYAGALERLSYGIWALTESGFEIETLEDAEAIYRRYTELLDQNNSEKRQEEEEANNDDEEVPATDEENARDDEIWKASRVSLLEFLGQIRPDAFEKLSYLLLCEAGFINADVVGKGADGGIDGWGTLQNELISFNICFQCKRWQKNVGSPQIRDFRGALHGRADKGLFFTTSRYTGPAITEATRDGGIPIDLIDGDRLCDLLKQYNLGVQTLNGTTTPIQDFFDNL